MTQARLNDLARRIDQLDAIAQSQAQQASRVIQRRIFRLRQVEAAARAAVHGPPASIEENTLALETKVKIAERAAAADLAEDMTRFLSAATEELHSWDVFLERLQVKIATTAGSRREQSERAIGELRRYRNKLDARVHEVPCSSAESGPDVRQRVQAARDELESRAVEVEAALVERSIG